MTEIGSGLYVPMEAEEVAKTASCGIPAPVPALHDCRRHRQARQTGGGGGTLRVRDPAFCRATTRSSKQPRMRSCGKGNGSATGDLFRQDESGNFYIVGRIKDMIRRSAENISAIEVEAALSRQCLKSRKPLSSG